MQIHLRRGAYDGDAVTFRACYFDIAGAESGTDYTDLLTYDGDYLGNTVSFLRFNVTLAGMIRLTGYDTDPKSAQNLCDAPQIRVQQSGGAWIADTLPDAVAQTVGTIPDDWDARWRDAYYTRFTMDYGGATWYFYRPAAQAWDATETYYKQSGASQTYYTDDGAFFGASRYHTYYYAMYQSDIGEFAALFGVFGTTSLTYSSTHDTYCARAGGAAGTPVFTSQRQDQQGLGMGSIVDSAFLTDHTYTGRLLQQFCEVDYDGIKYIGIVAIATSIDGIPQAATFAGISQKFWIARSPHINYGSGSGVTYGSGTFSDPSVGVGVPSIPNALKTTDYGPGMHIRAIDGNLIEPLFSQLWGQTGFWSQWKNIRFDPLSAIVSLHMIPMTYTGGTQSDLTIALTHIAVQNHKPPSRIAAISCGSIDIPEYYGNRLDYSSTQGSIYLPFCGDYPLDIQDVQGGSVSLTYHIDIATGDCVAFVVGTDRRGLETMSKQYKGNCAFKIPVSGSDAGGAGLLNALSSMIGGTVALASGNIATGAGGLIGGVIEAATAKVNSTSPQVQGSSACMGVLTPYIKIYRAAQARPDTYAQITGDVSQIGGTVTVTSDGYPITGFATFDDVELTVQATDQEIAEIRTLLKGGIYI